MVIKPEVISQEPMTLGEVKEVLKKHEKDGELNYRAGKTYEFIKAMKLLSRKDSDKAFKELTDLDIPRLKDVHIKKLIELLPTTEQEIDIIFYGATITVNKDNKKKILAALAPYTKKGRDSE